MSIQWFAERKEKVILKRILSKMFPTRGAGIGPRSVNSTRGAASGEAGADGIYLCVMARTSIQRHVFQDMGTASLKAYCLR